MTDYAQEKLLSDCVARSFAVRDAMALVISHLASTSDDAGAFFKRVSEALNARLDELPQGVSDLKEKVRAEQDWIVGAAQAFRKLGEP
jgi:hypothetical protein